MTRFTEPKKALVVRRGNTKNGGKYTIIRICNASKNEVGKERFLTYASVYISGDVEVEQGDEITIGFIEAFEVEPSYKNAGEVEITFYTDKSAIMGVKKPDKEEDAPMWDNIDDEMPF